MKDYRQLKQISKAALLEESNHLTLVLKALGVIALIIVALLVWAAFTTIDESANTFGSLVPKGQVQVVQHLDGGIVKQVLVTNGTKVKRGQLMVRLDPTQARAELDTMRSKEVALILDQERLRAFLENKPADLNSWAQKIMDSKYNTTARANEISQLLQDEKKHLDSMYDKKKTQSEVLQSQILQNEEKLREISNQKEVWGRHIELLKEEFAMYEKLKSQNLISHKDYLLVLRELNKAEGELVGLTSEMARSKEAIIEAKTKLMQLDSDSYEQSMGELGKVNDELLEVRHRIERLDTTVKRTNVRAPIDGIVKGVQVYPGTVVAPGGVMMEVVPFGQELVVESRVNPRDIGYIKVGDRVKVKVMTYDFARFGSIEGVLDNISASTFMDEDNRPYYRATTTLRQQYVGTEANKKMLLPGMTVEASIVTGEKTLLQYLLKPIQRATQEAFRER